METSFHSWECRFWMVLSWLLGHDLYDSNFHAYLVVLSEIYGRLKWKRQLKCYHIYGYQRTSNFKLRAAVCFQLRKWGIFWNGKGKYVKYFHIEILWMLNFNVYFSMYVFIQLNIYIWEQLNSSDILYYKLLVLILEVQRIYHWKGEGLLYVYFKSLWTTTLYFRYQLNYWSKA